MSEDAGAPHLLSGMEAETYGAAFADVYDSWYGPGDVATMVDLMAELSGSGSVLELGVGTGRVAIPLARKIAPRRVVGLDASREMLAALASKDADGRVETAQGDMVGGLPDGPFALVFATYNTLLNLPTLDAQRACVAAVANTLDDGGRFVVEAFVPPSDPEAIDEVRVRSMTVDQVVLSAARYDPERRVAAGQFIDLRDGEMPRLRPWQLRYTSIDELDRIAVETGLVVEHRWADSARTPFSLDSPTHLTVYQRRPNTTD